MNSGVPQQHLHRLLLTPPTLAAAQRRLAPQLPTIAGQPSLAIGCRVEVLAGAGRWQQRRIPSGLSLPGGVRSLHTRRRCERPLELRTRSVWKLLAAVGQQRLRADWPGVEIAAGLWFVSVSPYELEFRQMSPMQAKIDFGSRQMAHIWCISAVLIPYMGSHTTGFRFV